MTYDIGIFDSGLGGLTVYKKLKNRFPLYKFAYLADSIRSPYGTKTTSEIQEICRSNIDFFIQLGVKSVIIACHTASVAAYDYLSSIFDIEIIPMHFDTAEMLLKLPMNSSILIIGTKATINNGFYSNILKEKRKDIKVISTACPLLVEYIQNQFHDEEMLDGILDFYKISSSDFDYILLACTHFPLIRNELEKKLQTKPKIIDPADYLKFISFYHHDQSIDPEDEFFVNGDVDEFNRFAKTAINSTIKSSSVNLKSSTHLAKNS